MFFERIHICISMSDTDWTEVEKRVNRAMNELSKAIDEIDVDEEDTDREIEKERAVTDAYSILDSGPF